MQKYQIEYQQIISYHNDSNLTFFSYKMKKIGYSYMSFDFHTGSYTIYK